MKENIKKSEAQIARNLNKFLQGKTHIKVSRGQTRS
jgi:hypothetical protein